MHRRHSRGGGKEGFIPPGPDSAKESNWVLDFE